MRVNKQIRVPEVRVIGANGEQIGVMDTRDAIDKAEAAGLDLVEVSPNANPPVCKIINYGKFRYDQTKREKESKKAQHQIKVKEIKFRPNIDVHDMETKVNRAKEFLDKGNKVKVTCFFRGREMAHKDIGAKLIDRVIAALEDHGMVESPPKMLGRMLSLVIAPATAKKKKQTSKPLEQE